MHAPAHVDGACDVRSPEGSLCRVEIVGSTEQAEIVDVVASTKGTGVAMVDLEEIPRRATLAFRAAERALLLFSLRYLTTSRRGYGDRVG